MYSCLFYNQRRSCFSVYWFYKIFKRTYSEKLCILHAVITFIASNITFLPQHFLGLAGMPRRSIDYIEAYSG
ncbi:cbb3-type cytochrome c oxidase subunit I, partial [Candidatus Hodgkinia cicadicola]|uniref:cbb3-type cytochrome c oxidase subunit I n=1 Tax=Candidatus Hodgkinia cicadicola TaxID=573658 RepID=UPI0024151517